VSLFEIRDQSRIHRPPSQEVLGPRARLGEVTRRDETEKRAELGYCLFR
jgi:hypothetical protein